MSKASRNLRNCPAVAREITSRECGENRGSNYQCPADCPYNPWAPENYEEVLEIDTRLTAKILERFKRETTAAGGFRPERAAPFPSSIKDVNAFYCQLYYFERDAEGRTFVERWEKDGFLGLNNDESVLLGYLARMRPTVIEALRVLDEQSFEAVDLLGDPSKRFVARDMRLTPRVGRFGAYLMWLAPLPYYCRLIGMGHEIIDVQDFEPDEVLCELARHLGAPGGRAALQTWLACNFEKVADAQLATAQALHRRTIEQLDAKYCKTTYKPMEGLQKCVRRIENRRDVIRENPLPAEVDEGFVESFAWIEGETEGDSAQPALPTLEPIPHTGGMRALGRVLMGPGCIRIEASSRARNEALRARFERVFAGKVRFTGERVEDFGAQLLQGKEAPDESLVPPALLAQARRYHIQSSIIPNPGPARLEADLLRLDQQQWMDRPSPGLGGSTPREAAANPALRPKLLRLARKLVNRNDRENMADGGNRDLNWVLEELGLREIIFEAPHYEAPGPETDTSDEDFEDHELFHAYAEPALSPLPEAEFDRRMKALENVNRAAFINDLKSRFSDVLEATSEIMDEFLDEREKVIMLTAVAQGCLLLAPAGTKRLPIDELRLNDRFDVYLDEIMEIVSGETDGKQNEREIQRFLQQSRQPGVTLALSSVVLDFAFTGPGKQRLKMEWLPLMLAYLKSLVDELDCAVLAWRGQ